jgi:hypothetical protein
MVYLVYSLNEKFNGIYDNESEAYSISKMKTDDTGCTWKVVDLVHYKSESSIFSYFEEDPEYDEAYYINKISDEKKKLKVLEEFIDYFILLFAVLMLYSCIILILLM